MSKSNAFETDLLGLIFNGTTIDNVAVNATSSPLTSLYLSLHSSDPGEAGDQTTNEVAYTSYARKAVDRDSDGFTVSGNSVVLAANQDFVACTGSTATATHFAIGTASSGAGKILYSGTVTPNISISTGVTPRLTTGTTVTED
jgi:hypothetical protein